MQSTFLFSWPRVFHLVLAESEQSRVDWSRVFRERWALISLVRLRLKGLSQSHIRKSALYVSYSALEASFGSLQETRFGREFLADELRSVVSTEDDRRSADSLYERCFFITLTWFSGANLT